MMIDYLRGRIRLPVPLPCTVHDGHFMSVDALGGVQTVTAKRKRVVGSFEAVMMLRAPSTGEIEFEGNPAKFLQGHNLYGTDDPIALLWAALCRIEATPGALPCKLADIGLVSADGLSLYTELSRVDCTAMFLLDTPGDVDAFLRAAQVAGRLRDRGRSGLGKAYAGGGVVFGDASGKSFTHRQIIWYSKGRELQKNSLPEPFMGRDDAMGWVKRTLRCEVRLGRNYLKKAGLRVLSDWSAEKTASEWRSMVDRMDWNEADVQPANLDGLSPTLRGVHAMWLTGADLSQVYPRRTFYRHRSAILKALSVDISIPCPKEPTAHVVPIKRRIELKLAGRPPWADEIDAELRKAGAFVFDQVA